MIVFKLKWYVQGNLNTPCFDFCLQRFNCTLRPKTLQLH